MSTINRTLSIPAQAALDIFMAKIAPLNAFAKNYSSEAAAKGSAIQVPLISNLTATTFNSAYNGTGGVVNTVTVNLTNHRIATVDLSDVQQLNTDVVVEHFAPQLGNALAKLILQDVWSLVLTTNYGAAVVTTAAANWTKTQVRAMRLALEKKNVDTSGASFVCNEDVFDALLGDTGINYAMYYGGSEGIREAKIPRLMGMNVIASNLVPANGITLYGFAAVPDAIAVAFRQFNPVVPSGAYEDFGTVTDPSGISLTSRVLYDPNVGKRYWSLECLMGYAVGVSSGLRIATGPN